MPHSVPTLTIRSYPKLDKKVLNGGTTFVESVSAMIFARAKPKKDKSETTEVSIAQPNNGDTYLTLKCRVRGQLERKCELDEIIKTHAYQNPDIPTISPLEVKEMERDENVKLWLVDVRSPEEMKVSMIKGAIAKAKFEESPPDPSDTKNVIAPYCTVGRRYGGWLFCFQAVLPCLFSEYSSVCLIYYAVSPFPGVASIVRNSNREVTLVYTIAQEFYPGPTKLRVTL